MKDTESNAKESEAFIDVEEDIDLVSRLALALQISSHNYSFYSQLFSEILKNIKLF